MHQASRALFAAWVLLLLVRVVLPSAFGILLGTAAVDLVRGGVWQPTVLGAVLVAFLSQVLPPIHISVSQNLGALTGAMITDQLIDVTTRPVGISHLERSDLADDIAIAREFDYGITSIPMYMSMEFVTAALIPFAAGWVAALTLVVYGWWLPIPLVGAWLFTHWALKRSAVWSRRDSDEANDARRESQYYFDVAVQPTDAKEVRLFGLAPFVVDRFARARKSLLDLQYEDTRLSRGWLMAAATVILVANLATFGWLATSAVNGRPIDEVVTVAQLIIAVQAIAFGSLSTVLDDASAPIKAVRRLRTAIPGGPPPDAGPNAATSRTRGGIELDLVDVHFRYRNDAPEVLAGLSIHVHPGESLAIVGANGAGKTTLAKLLCRFYDPTSGAIFVDGERLSALDPENWRAEMTAVFQDVLKVHLTVAENVDPSGAVSDEESSVPCRTQVCPGSRPQPFSGRRSLKEPICQAASGSAWHWQDQFVPYETAHGCSSSTNPPRAWTSGANTRSFAITCISPQMRRRS